MYSNKYLNLFEEIIKEMYIPLNADMYYKLKYINCYLI